MATDNVIPHPSVDRETVTVQLEKLREWLDCSDCSDALAGAHEATEDFLSVSLCTLDSDTPKSKATRDMYELEMHRNRRDIQRNVKGMAEALKYLRDEIGALLLHPKAEEREEVAAE
jgi:hypothetical protein